MYQTLATHRLLNKEGVEVNGKEKLVSTGDKHIVVVRPKQIVDSSPTTWANETFRLRCSYPDYFEIDVETVVSREMRAFLSRLQGDVFLFSDMSVRSDIGNVTSSLECEHRAYEKKHANHLIWHRICKAETELAANSSPVMKESSKRLKKFTNCWKL